MSLIPTANSGAPTSDYYYIENLGGSGIGSDDVPCIKAGDFLGGLRVNNVSTGMILFGGSGTVNPTIQGIRGGWGSTAVNGGSVRLGASATSFQNIVLTDNLTTINGAVAMDVSGADLTIGGDLVFTNGGIGSSVSGFYSVNTAALNCPDASDTVVPTPSTLTTGWHVVSASTAPGGQAQQQVATVVRYTQGVGFLFGGCVSNTAGSGRFGFNVSTDRTTMVLSNSTGAAQNGVTVNFSKIAN